MKIFKGKQEKRTRHCQKNRHPNSWLIKKAERPQAVLHCYGKQVAKRSASHCSACRNSPAAVERKVRTVMRVTSSIRHPPPETSWELESLVCTGALVFDTGYTWVRPFSRPRLTRLEAASLTQSKRDLIIPHRRAHHLCFGLILLISFFLPFFSLRRFMLCQLRK